MSTDAVTLGLAPSVITPEQRRAGGMAIAASASLGAGAIHAAAVGVHADHRAAALLFVVVAGAQLVWGAVALRPEQRRRWAVAGAALHGALVAGWLQAKVTGIPLVDGLTEPEPVQTADGVAAALAATAALVAGGVARGWTGGQVRRARIGLVTAAVGMLAGAGLVSAADHRHPDGHLDGHADGHAGLEAVADHEPAVVPPKPYRPDQPIDLGGVEGVTPEQQARAENLIAITLLRLPKYADPAVAEAAGFRSIGDGFTGHEHFINRAWIDDGRILDPDYPESLVYRVEGGRRTLVAAMFMLSTGSTLDDVPTEIGGKLVQWHIHDNLCFTPDPDAPKIAGLTQADGTCAPPLQKGTQVPMVHVWIVPHECGPFAALEGVAGGQIKEGEERLCDHAHGA